MTSDSGPEKGSLRKGGLFSGGISRSSKISQSSLKTKKWPGSVFQSLGMYVACQLSGPLRLRVQSRSRTRLRIAASSAFLFRACFKGVWDTIAPLSRG